VFALAPNGRHFVFNTDKGFYLRAFDELEAVPITGTEPLSASPTFSPDGQAIAYWDFSSSSLKRVAIGGGAPVVVASFSLYPYGLSWSTDGTILLGQAEGIYRVSANGGVPELIIPTRGEELYYGPQLLPDGDSVLFSATTNPLDWDSARVVVQSLSSGERTVTDVNGSDVRYLPTGHLIYAVDDALFAIEFDVGSLTVSGGAVPLAQGLMRATANITAAANYGVSENGALAYLSGRRTAELHTLVWVDREGRESLIGVPPQNYTSVRLSPDGTRAALDTFGEQMDIWIWDFDRQLLRKLTRSQTVNLGPIWTPDSERIVWSRARTSAVQEVFWQAADGSGTPQVLTLNSRLPVAPTDISPDGTTLLYSQYLTPRGIWMLPVQSAPAAGEPLIATAAEESNAVVSPDGRWLAYQSEESGRPEIYVRPFPDVDTRVWQLSTDGGTRPLWRADGQELFYYVDRGSSGAFMSVSVELEPSFSPGAPRLLFEGPYVPPLGLAAASNAFYDVSPSGQRFLVIKNVTDNSDNGSGRPGFAEPPRIIIVEHWLAEL
jgi:Tol biopolymer transport system component